MPRAMSMTWNRKTKRWFKKQNGKQLTVTASKLRKLYPQLVVDETEEGSYQAANEWWADRTADNQKKIREQFRTTAVELATQYRNKAQEALNGNHSTVWQIEQLAARMRKGELDPTAAFSLLQEIAHPTPTTATGETIGNCAKVFLAAKRSEMGAEISEGRFDNIRHQLDRFIAAVGELRPISAVNSGTLVDYRAGLLNAIKDKQISAVYAKNCMQVAKQFLMFCHETDRIESLPKNFHSKSLRISVEIKEVETLPLPEIKALLKAATERTRLFILLMLNIGGTQKDVSDVTHKELDLDAGTISRKRSKTKKKASTPTVTYYLWPEVVELLRKYRNLNSDLVLTTAGECR